MASFNKLASKKMPADNRLAMNDDPPLTRANMMKYIKEELDEPQHADVKEDTEDDKRKKAFDKRNKQFEEDKKVMPPRGGRGKSSDE